MEYAQARIQARFAERPERAAWQRLETLGDLGALIEAASRAGLGRWVAGLDGRMDLHRIEISLRQRLRGVIHETALWMPLRWREPMLWTSHLADLPALVHVARGGPALAWMLEDPVIRFYASQDAGAHSAATLGLAQRRRLCAGPSEPPHALERMRRAAFDTVLETWSQMWIETWPPRARSERASVMRVLECLSAHRASFHDLPSPERALLLRAALEQQLRRLFRASMLLPGAAFAYLAMLALDLERVRAMLLRCTLASRPGSLA